MSPWTCHCAGWDTLDKPGKTPDELLLYRWQGAVPTTLLPCHRARRNLSFGCRVELAAALLLGSAMGLCRVQHHPESYSESNRILKHILGLSISKQALETAVEEDAADVKADVIGRESRPLVTHNQRPTTRFRYVSSLGDISTCSLHWSSTRHCRGPIRSHSVTISTSAFMPGRKFRSVGSSSMLTV